MICFYVYFDISILWRCLKLLSAEIVALSLFLQEAPGMKGGQHSGTFWKRLMRHQGFSFYPIRFPSFGCRHFFCPAMPLIFSKLFWSVLSHLFELCNSKILNPQNGLLDFRMMLVLASFLVNLPPLLSWMWTGLLICHLRMKLGIWGSQKWSGLIKKDSSLILGATIGVIS